MKEEHLYAFFPFKETVGKIEEVINRWIENNSIPENEVSYHEVKHKDSEMAFTLELQVETEVQKENLSGGFSDAIPAYRHCWTKVVKIDHLEFYDPDGNTVKVSDNYIQKLLNYV